MLQMPSIWIPVVGIPFALVGISAIGKLVVGLRITIAPEIVLFWTSFGFITILSPQNIIQSTTDPRLANIISLVVLLIILEFCIWLLLLGFEKYSKPAAKIDTGDPRSVKLSHIPVIVFGWISVYLVTITNLIIFVRTNFLKNVLLGTGG